MSINLRTIINSYKSERYNSFIVYGDAGIGKSSYVQEFIHKNQDIKIAYFDILEEYTKIQSAQSIFGFTPNKFITWALSLLPIAEHNERDLLVIDNFDFLVNTWSPSEKIEMIKLIEKYIEKSVTINPLIFVIHSDPIIETYLDHHSLIRFSDLEVINTY